MINVMTWTSCFFFKVAAKAMVFLCLQRFLNVTHFTRLQWHSPKIWK